LTYEQIGRRFGVSRERIRQIMLRAFKKLKKSEELLKLRAA